MRRASALILAVTVLSTSGCGLGRRVTGAPRGGLQPPATPSPSAEPKATTAFVNAAGFPLEVGFLAPGRVAAYRSQGTERIAPPGTHFVTIEVTIANPTDDRPAPFAIGKPARVPSLHLMVPRREAATLGLRCGAPAGLERTFALARLCPLEVRTSSTRFGDSPLTTETIAAASQETDYFYTEQRFADLLLDRVDPASWQLAVQIGPSAYVAVRSAGGGTTVPTAFASASPSAGS